MFSNIASNIGAMNVLHAVW